MVALADGDTVTVLDAGRVQHRVRLQGIDAPEGRQPFGQRSKQYLADLVFSKDAGLAWHLPSQGIGCLSSNPKHI